MDVKTDKRVSKNLRLSKGGRKRDIYEDAKWKKRSVDVDELCSYF